MKIKFTLILIMTFGLLLTRCKEKEQKVEVEEVKIDLVNDEFPEAKQEVMETFGAIAQSLKDGDIDKLISFHAYSPKFTEFKNGVENQEMVAKQTKLMSEVFLAL
jgi:hypothetical protein